MLLFTLLTFKSTSQSVTKTNDSLTVISTKHLSLMVRDLEEGDKCAKKLVLVEDNLDLCETKTKHLDSLLSIADAKETLYKQNEVSYQSIIGVKDTQIEKLKKSRKMISIGGIVAIILTFIL